MILNILILNSYQYNFIFISLLVLKIGIKLEKNISHRREGGCLIMAMSTGACWGGHFCVKPGFFVSNRAFLCRTMHSAVELGFLCRTSVIISVRGRYVSAIYGVVNSWGTTIRFMTCRAALQRFRDFTKLSGAAGPRFRKPFLSWRESRALPLKFVQSRYGLGQHCMCNNVVAHLWFWPSFVTVFVVLMLCEGSQSVSIQCAKRVNCKFGHMSVNFRRNLHGLHHTHRRTWAVKPVVKRVIKIINFGLVTPLESVIGN